VGLTLSPQARFGVNPTPAQINHEMANVVPRPRVVPRNALTARSNASPGRGRPGRSGRRRRLLAASGRHPATALAAHTVQGYYQGNPWKTWGSWKPRDCVSGDSVSGCDLFLRFGTVRSEVQIFSPRLFLKSNTERRLGVPPGGRECGKGARERRYTYRLS